MVKNSTEYKKKVKNMIIYAVSKTYTNNDKIKYQVLPYDLIGTIKVHFKLKNGLFSLVSFLKNCRLTEKHAIKLQKKLSELN